MIQISTTNCSIPYPNKSFDRSYKCRTGASHLGMGFAGQVLTVCGCWANCVTFATREIVAFRVDYTN
jgi:hypothetical protein